MGTQYIGEGTLCHTIGGAADVGAMKLWAQVGGGE